MANKESLFAGLHILMPAIPDGPADAGRRLRRYWYRESRCQVRTGWQKLCDLCGYKSVKICVNPVNLVKKTSCLGVFVAKNPFNLRNLRLKNSCQFVSIFFVPLCLSGISTTVESSLQIRLFMQNKAKFRKVKLNVNNVLTKDYDKKTLGQRGKKQSQTNPNKAKFKKAKMNVTSIITVDYENKTHIRTPKKQSQTSKRQKPMQPSLPQGIMKKTALSASDKTKPNEPNQTQFSNNTISEISQPVKPKTAPQGSAHAIRNTIYAIRTKTAIPVNSKNQCNQRNPWLTKDKNQRTAFFERKYRFSYMKLTLHA